jgi:hypothetical protein
MDGLKTTPTLMTESLWAATLGAVFAGLMVRLAVEDLRLWRTLRDWRLAFMVSILTALAMLFVGMSAWLILR